MQILPLAFLAPELIVRILSGDPNVLVTTTQIINGGRMPERWAEQLAGLDRDLGGPGACLACGARGAMRKNSWMTPCHS